MQFGSGIEVNNTFLISLSEYHTLSFVKVYIFTVQFTNSPTRMPVDERKSIIARSRLLVQLSRSCSNCSSESTSFTSESVLTLWIRLTGLWRCSLHLLTMQRNWKDASHIVNGNFTGLMFFLIIG